MVERILNKSEKENCINEKNFVEEMTKVKCNELKYYGYGYLIKEESESAVLRSVVNILITCIERMSEYSTRNTEEKPTAMGIHINYCTTNYRKQTLNHLHTGNFQIKMVDVTGKYLVDKNIKSFDSAVNLDRNLSEILIFLQKEMKDKKMFFIFGTDNTEESDRLKKNIFRMFFEQLNDLNVIDGGIVSYAELFYFFRIIFIEKSSALDGYKTIEKNVLELNDFIRECNVVPYERYLYDVFSELQNLTSNNIQISIDAAHGIVRKFVEIFKENQNSYIEILETFYKDEKACGAEYVYEYKKKPKVAASNSLTGVFNMAADKLLFYKENDGKFCIFDGDAICVFLSVYVNELLKNIFDVNSTDENCMKEEENVCHSPISSASTGEIQTNKISFGVFLSDMSCMSCMDYLSQRQINFMLTSFSFREMLERSRSCEIGLVWTPTGHGTIMFSRSAIKKLKKVVSINTGNEQQSKKVTSAKILLCFSKLFNNFCTEAFSTFLVCKSTFKSHYDLNLYRQTHTRVINILINKEIEIDRNIVVRPRSLQKDINYLLNLYSGRVVLKYKKAVTEKGENVSGFFGELTVFAEAGTVEKCDILCLGIAELFYTSCQGIGEYPMISYGSDEHAHNLF